MRHRTLLALAAGALVIVLLGGATGNPWPAITPTATHHTVLVLGDSVASEVVDQLPAAFADHGLQATVVNGTLGASNLIDNLGYFTPDAYQNYLMDRHPEADTVVVQFIGSCRATCSGGLTYGDWLFTIIWQQRVLSIVNHAHALGKKIVWVTPPPVSQTLFSPFLPLILTPAVATNLAWLDILRFGPWAGAMTSWWDSVTDTAKSYQAFITYDGASHLVRVGDGVHLTPDGAYRAAVWTAATVSALWAGA
jgi:hypothetical protein